MDERVGKMASFLLQMTNDKTSSSFLKDRIGSILDNEIKGTANQLGYTSYNFKLMKLDRSMDPRDMISSANEYRDLLLQIKKECNRIVNNNVDLSNAERLNDANKSVDLSSIKLVEDYVTYLRGFTGRKKMHNTIMNGNSLAIFFYNIPRSRINYYVKKYEKLK